jgi:hypothetical protein
MPMRFVVTRSDSGEQSGSAVHLRDTILAKGISGGVVFEADLMMSAEDGYCS